MELLSSITDSKIEILVWTRDVLGGFFYQMSTFIWDSRLAWNYLLTLLQVFLLD